MKPPRPAPKSAPVEKKEPSASPLASATSLVRHHLSIGWWTVLIFLTLGLVLETLHGFKIAEYVKVSNEIRRLMWTLAHAHGTLLGLVNLAFAWTAQTFPAWPESRRHLASNALLGATLLMPAGFFLGGLFFYAGDPGLGILLVPVGGLLLFIAVLLTALAVRQTGGKTD